VVVDVTTAAQLVTNLITTVVALLGVLGVTRRWVKGWIRQAAADAIGGELTRLADAVEKLRQDGTAAAGRLAEHGLRLDTLARRVDELFVDHGRRRWP
jgi:hypothetical protein